VRIYDYNYSNRLTSVISGTLTTEFTYPSTLLRAGNGAGDRVVKTVDGVVTDYVLDPAVGLTQVLQETTAGQATSYLYGADLLAQYDSGTWAYHLNDGLGSVRQLADAAGQVVQSYSFSPFGVPLGESGGEPYGYAGEQWDASAGLVFLRARYYQLEVGRFISKDPFPGFWSQPRTLNRFVYVGNNPVNRIDPSGLLDPISLLAYNRAKAIIDNAGSNVDALIQLFEANDLPGGSSADRLQWILEITTSLVRGSYLQFALFPPGDAGFCDELADERFYTGEGEWSGWTGEETRQMGHFLTAVALGFNPEGAYYQAFVFDYLFDKLPRTGDHTQIQPLVPFFPSDPETYALSLIVGHEMIGDQPGIGQFGTIPEQYYAATDEAIALFRKAVGADKDRRYEERDSYLQMILGDPLGREAIPSESRIGNSMPDLRLSVKGWRFGQEIRNGDVGTRQQAADWLRREIYDPSQIGSGSRNRRQ
jgi:RHS repeat-associated protein